MTSLSILTDNIQAVVFDLDDTLYPELRYVRSGFRAVAARMTQGDFDTDRIFEMLWRAFEAGPRDRVFNTVLQQLGRADDPQIVAELVGLYRCHRPTLQLEPQVLGAIEKLHQKYKLGLITDGYLPTQRLKVEALRLENTFDHIIYTEELGREFWKPSSRSYELMAETLGCLHPQCVYIADNPAKDFIAPNRLGWLTIQLLRPDRVPREMVPASDGNARITIENITELLQRKI